LLGRICELKENGIVGNEESLIVSKLVGCAYQVGETPRSCSVDGEVDTNWCQSVTYRRSNIK
jgi:hypothetical protein